MLSVTAQGETKASPQQTLEVVLAPDFLPRTSPGAKIERVDPAWPAVGSTMTFKVMGARMEARISESRPPDEVTMVMKAPGSSPTVRHRFVPLPNGGTRLEKTIELPDGLLNRLMIALMLRRQLRGETARTIALADEVAAGRLAVPSRAGAAAT